MTADSAGSAPRDSARRRDAPRFTAAAGGGAALSTLIFLWLLAGPHLDMVSGRGLLSSFLDAQARALLHGHLYVSAAQASIEGFSLRGHSYLYFGMWPTVLRIPVLLFTHSLDGRLTQISMLLAFVVLMVGTASLHWQIRCLIRPEAGLATGDLWAAAMIQVAVGAGGVALFLAGWQVVYHETELWGAATAIAGISASLKVSVAPSTQRIIAAAVLALLAILSRPSVGLAPSLVLIFLAVGLGARLSAGWWERRSHPLPARWARAIGEFGIRSRDASWQTGLAVLTAGAIPLLTYAAVQLAKFHMLGLPVTRQLGVNLDPMARASVAANHGSVFGLKFVPSTLLATVRPDAVGTVRGFPFVGLPHSQPTLVGHPLLESVQPSLSAVTSMPLLCLLALVGVVVVTRSRKLWGLAVPLLATAIAAAPVLLVSDIATRYMSDLVPLLLVAALVGLQRLLAHAAASSRRLGRRALPAIAAILTGWGIVVNGGAGLETQRLLAPDTSEPDRAAFVGFQQSVDQVLGRRPSDVLYGSHLPGPHTGAPANLLVLGHCLGLYVSALDYSWLPVERTPRTGLHELSFAPSPSTRRQALLALGPRGHGVTLAVSGAASATRLSLLVENEQVGASAPVTLSGRASVTVSIDAFAGAYSATVSLNGRRLFSAQAPDENAPQTVGADPGNRSLARFDGYVRPIPQTAPVCHRIVRAAGSPGAEG